MSEGPEQQRFGTIQATQPGPSNTGTGRGHLATPRAPVNLGKLIKSTARLFAWVFSYLLTNILKQISVV